MNDLFRKLAHTTSIKAGSPVAFLLALAVVLAWGLTGPLFGFSDTWQLVINTGTTIVTFLMVFLIQNTQNRDSRAIHMKLDELIIYTRGADNAMVELENMSDEQMDKLDAHFHRLAKALGHDEIERRGNGDGVEGGDGVPKRGGRKAASESNGRTAGKA